MYATVRVRFSDPASVRFLAIPPPS
jgi:hypothetical protein